MSSLSMTHLSSNGAASSSSHIAQNISSKAVSISSSVSTSATANNPKRAIAASVAEVNSAGVSNTAFLSSRYSGSNLETSSTVALGESSLEECESGQNSDSALDEPYPLKKWRGFDGLRLWWKRHTVISSWLVALIVAFVLEGVVFNYAYFTFDAKQYQLHEVKLSWNEQLNRQAQILTSQNNVVSINNIDFPVNRIYLEFLGSREQISGRIFIRDHSSSQQLFSANTFIVEPSHSELNQTNKLLLVIPPLYECAVVLDHFKSPAVALTKLAFNVPPAYNFMVLRWSGIFLAVGLLLMILRTGFYRESLDWRKHSHKGIQGCLLLGCYAVALVLLGLVHPSHTGASQFKFLEYDSVWLGSPDGSLWLDFPQNSLELESHDPFVQQLEAYLNRRLNLNLREDPKLALLEHPYDPSLRKARDANSHWDHSYYDHKFYSYYAPSLVWWWYAPCYFITGKVPTLVLSICVLTMLVITAVFWVMPVLHMAWGLRSNALLFFGSELVMVAGSMLYWLQSHTQFYVLPNLNNFLLGLLLIGCAYRVLFTSSSILRQLLLAGVGILIVALVLSRVTGLFICLTFILPAAYQFLYLPFKQRSSPCKLHALEGLWPLVIVLVGAVGVMWFNYQRFDSVFEFGQRYCTSWLDVTAQYANAASFRLVNLSNAFYHSFIENLEVHKDFPFITSNLEQYRNYAANQIKVGNFGIWSLPNQILLGLWLCCWLKTSKTKPQISNEASLDQAQMSEVKAAVPQAEMKKDAAHHNVPIQKPLAAIEQDSSMNLWAFMRYNFVLVIGSLVFTGYLNFVYGAPCSRYSVELLFFSNLMASLLCLKFIKFEKGELGGQIFYWAVVWCLVATVGIGLLLPFENFAVGGFSSNLNPDVIPYFKKLFEPFAGI